LLAQRVYKARLTGRSRPLRIIREGRGSHFDPDVVDAFFARQDEFLAIAARHARRRRPPGRCATAAFATTAGKSRRPKSRQLSPSQAVAKH
jgi:HD-GYP domain-containing protein (c-di-GMP phosphodiesterase class II)